MPGLQCKPPHTIVVKHNAVARAGSESELIGLLFDAYKLQRGGSRRTSTRIFCAEPGIWGSGAYSDEQWGIEGWTAECEVSQTTAEEGIDLAAFTDLYTNYRATELMLDFNKAGTAGMQPYASRSWYYRQSNAAMPTA